MTKIFELPHTHSLTHTGGLERQIVVWSNSKLGRIENVGGIFPLLATNPLSKLALQHSDYRRLLDFRRSQWPPSDLKIPPLMLIWWLAD